jgi:hypothetical protein
MSGNENGVVKIRKDLPHLKRLDQLGEEAMKSQEIMDLVVNGATLNSVNKDMLRGIIRVIITDAAVQLDGLERRRLVTDLALDLAIITLAEMTPFKSREEWRETLLTRAIERDETEAPAK